MRTIMVANSKGGCGKTTLAANLASYYANQGNNVALADFDSQGSSSNWLTTREDHRAPITGIKAWKDAVRAPRNTDYVIMDAPAGIHGKQVTELVKRAQTIILPVLPSPLDIHAAADFIKELLVGSKVSKKNTKLAVVANRAKENTVSYGRLEKFLKRLDIPFITTFRDTQNYIHAAERGLGIFELPPSSVEKDLDQWKPLTRWLNSKRSLPG